MPKEWILNMATNRWGLNKKNSVGPVSEWIRESSPKTIEDWKTAYLAKLAEMLKKKGLGLNPQEYLNELGNKLYVKINEVLQAEIEEVTQEDCCFYIQSLVVNRTFDGYQTEIKTIYGQLQNVLGVTIHPAPDEWDRLYNVDFFVQVREKYIGIQIKPITYNQTPEVYRWKEWLGKSHQKFKDEYGGQVFIVFSFRTEDKKTIFNKEVVEEISEEIRRLSK